ncbi:MAG: CDP-glycerol glycerophosphotransferase family protein, partial [Anaerovoracaceae bacterium]|nr:CDP-glycerol glycerophosphotransferase family protein [Anaerovoracaceae bacterium]
MKYLYAGFCKRLPVKKNLVLFESFHGRDISDSPLYIARALLEISDINEYEMYFATADMKKHKQQIAELELDVKLVDIHSKEYAQVLATSEYLVNNSSFPSYFVKRKGQKYLQTWHGTPL